MRIMPKLISAGFATCALASAAMPAFSGPHHDDQESVAVATVGSSSTIAASPMVPRDREAT